MDTKQNRYGDVIHSTLDDIDPNPIVQTPSGFGIRAEGTITEKDGIKYVSNVQMLGISLIASENVVDETTRIKPESVQSPRGHCGGAFHILDDFAFLPNDEMTLEHVQSVAAALHSQPVLTLMHQRGHTRIPVMTHESHPFLPPLEMEMSKEMETKLNALGISPKVLSLDIPSSVEKALHGESVPSMSYIVLMHADSDEITVLSPPPQEEKVSIVDVMQAMPFGTGISGVCQKRAFDYELEGGV